MRRTLFLMLAVASLFSSCAIVDSSEAGIKFKKFAVTEQGELQAIPITGWVVYNPITTSVYSYPVNIQRVDYQPFTVTTKDAAVFKMDPRLAYQIRRDMVVKVFSKYRVGLRKIEDGYMKTVIYDAYRITANRYTSDELMASRAQFEAEVRVMLDSALLNEGFMVSEFTSQITPPESLSAAIEAKNTAIQESLKAENEVKKAEAQAKIAIAQAEGEAKALKIKADGEAYYNRTVAASLNALLVQQYALERWDGKLPEYTGGNTIPMINLSTK